MRIIFPKGYQCDLAFIFKLVYQPTDGEEIRMLAKVLLYQKETALLEDFSLVLALIF